MTACALLVCWLGADHLYRECPHYRRQAGPDERDALACNFLGCDPLDETVCGWCRRVWEARHR